MRIAILGWGSLLWDKRAEFDWFEKQYEQWQCDGPTLKLEFSRVSESRGNALTLVLDTDMPPRFNVGAPGNQNTAVRTGAIDNQMGWGVVNGLAALQVLETSVAAKSLSAVKQLHR